MINKDDFIPHSYDENMNIYLKFANAMQDILQAYPTDLITHTKVMHQKFVKMNCSFVKEIPSSSKGV
jgi:hypothetical protein